MTAPRSTLVLGLLAIATFSLAVVVEPWSAARQSDRAGSLLALLFGDGRRLFANHFFAKADAYFHRGVYPSIFDPPRKEEMHMVSEGQSGTAAEPHDEHDHGAPEPGEPSASRTPRTANEDEDHDEATCTDPTHQHKTKAIEAEHQDWIARWNDHFSPRAHTHLDGGDTREMLPWLKLSAELDPNNVQNFTITAYWLRTRLKRVTEAEEFLREGLRQNPGSPEILFELGVLCLDNHQDPARARNLFEMALQHWQRRETGRAEPDNLLGEAILARLARLEEDAGHLPQAVAYLRTLRGLSPNPAAIDQLIIDLQLKMTRAPVTP